jgi:hypothetical protein
MPFQWRKPGAKPADLSLQLLNLRFNATQPCDAGYDPDDQHDDEQNYDCGDE